MEDFEPLFELKIESKVEEQEFIKSDIRVEDVKDHYRGYLEEDLKSEHRAVFLATLDDEMVGMIVGRIYRALKVVGYERRGSVSNLFVRDEFRQRGYGKQLVEALTDWFRSREVSGLTLSIYRENTVAREMYQRAGFEDQLISMYKKL